MSWGDYVRNQVEKILLSEGFSVPVAQGGGKACGGPIQPNVTGQQKRSDF